MANTFGMTYGRPKIKIGYGSSIAKVKKNIRRQTAKGGRNSSSNKQSFGFGK